MCFAQWFPFSRADPTVKVLAQIWSGAWTTPEVSARLFWGGILHLLSRHDISLSELGGQLHVLEISLLLPQAMPALYIVVHSLPGASLVWAQTVPWVLQLFEKILSSWSFFGWSFAFSVLSLCQDWCISEWSSLGIYGWPSSYCLIFSL